MADGDPLASASESTASGPLHIIAQRAAMRRPYQIELCLPQNITRHLYMGRNLGTYLFEQTQQD